MAASSPLSWTDGVPEAADADGNMFGTDKMLDALNGCGGDAPDALIKCVREAVDAFVKDAEQFDDLTMLSVEYKGKMKTRKEVLYERQSDKS